MNGSSKPWKEKKEPKLSKKLMREPKRSEVAEAADKKLNFRQGCEEIFYRQLERREI